MNYMERREADRREASAAGWRQLERRARQRRRVENAKIAHWMDKFHTARLNNQRGGL